MSFLRQDNHGRNSKTETTEYLHIKDLYCAFENKDVKAVEIRWCDDKDEIIQHISELKREYNYEYESEEINYADKRLCN